MVSVSLKTIGSTSGTQIFVTPSVLIGGNIWTRISGTLTPTWTGTLVEARWRVFSYPLGSTNPFNVDDAVMSVAIDPAELTLVPGSWRRDVSP